MKKLKDEYKSFLEDIEKNIKNQDDLSYIKQRFNTFMGTVTDEISYIINLDEERINNLEEKQNEIENKISSMQEELNDIHEDIYEENEEFDFEIVCPYCENEFIIDIDETKTEVECPNCNNIIELDWTGDIYDEENEDFECLGGNCSSCHGCDEDDDM